MPRTSPAAGGTTPARSGASSAAIRSATSSATSAPGPRPTPALAPRLPRATGETTGSGGRQRRQPGDRGGATAEDLRGGQEQELAGIDAIRDALGRAYEDVKDLGKGIGDALVSGFRGAEDAVGEFVKTGKLGMRDLVTSILADFAKVSARRFLFAPLSRRALQRARGRGARQPSAGLHVAATVSHAGGMAGAGPQRLVEAARLPAGAAAACRHALVACGPTSADDPAARRAGAEPAPRPRPSSGRHFGGGVTVNIMTSDAESFRRSRTQVASDIARAVAFGRRGM